MYNAGFILGGNIQINENKLCFKVVNLSSQILVVWPNYVRTVFPASSKIPLPLLMLNRTFSEGCLRSHTNKHAHTEGDIYLVLIGFINTDISSASLLSKNMFAGTVVLTFSFKVETCKTRAHIRLLTFDKFAGVCTCLLARSCVCVQEKAC